MPLCNFNQGDRINVTYSFELNLNKKQKEAIFDTICRSSYIENFDSDYFEWNFKTISIQGYIQTETDMTSLPFQFPSTIELEFNTNKDTNKRTTLQFVSAIVQ